MEYTIKLQDFAAEMGVSDRAIQKHLKKHEDKLQGKFERRGPNGTWLSEDACEFIRGLMRQRPVVIGDGEQFRQMELLKDENKALMEENKRLLEALNSAKDAIIALGEEKAALQIKEVKMELLETTAQEASERAAELEAELNKFKPTLFGLYKKQ